MKTINSFFKATFALWVATIFCIAACSPKTQVESPSLKVELTGAPPSTDVVASYTTFDKGGNTSVSNDAGLKYKWSGAASYAHGGFGYYDADGKELPYIKRNRDLGQTFKYTGDARKQLESITVQLGFGDNVVRPGMYGHHVSVQLFKVSGKPVVNDNGSDSTMEGFHGWPHDRVHQQVPASHDDYITGENYQSIGVFTGATFPAKKDFGFASDNEEVSPGDARLKGNYLQFVLPKVSPVVLEPGQEYAFLVMIDSLGEERGFTLANNYTGSYPGGHGIRRPGSGTFPPETCDPSKAFTDPANKAALDGARFNPDFHKRVEIPPGTNGYPDVDTWRDFVFFIQAK